MMSEGLLQSKYQDAHCLHDMLQGPVSHMACHDLRYVELCPGCLSECAEEQQQNGAAPRSSEPLEQLVAASGKLALLDRMMDKLVAHGHRYDAVQCSAVLYNRLVPT
jgi:hypothetical protein